MKNSISDRLFSGINVVLCFLVGLITIYPFIYVASMSISAPEYVVANMVWFLPKGFSLKAYNIILENPDLWRSYYNTIWYAVVGTALSVTMTILAAYPLSRKKFFIKNQLSIFFTIPMFFNGGIIPFFILINNLGLYNTRLAIVLPVGAAAWYIIMARTFLQSIPDSIYESAKIDGANEFKIMLKIFVPLSMPIIAVLGLYYAVEYWNSYFNAMVFLPDKDKQPLQLYLMKVLVENSNDMFAKNTYSAREKGLVSLQLKYAVIIVAILPILLVYPFLQKYFVKGVMIGAIKG